MPALCTSLICLAMLLVVPAGAAALPTGAAHGVRVTDQGREVRIAFGARADGIWRSIVGRGVTITCTDLAAEATVRARLRVLERGRVLRVALPAGNRDICRVWREEFEDGPRRVLHPRTRIVSVPLTEQGAGHLAEERLAHLLGTVLDEAAVPAVDDEPRYHTPSRLVADLSRWRPELARRLVVPASPADTPARGKIGYFRDRPDHMAVVAVAATGRRLFVEIDRGFMLSTNILDFLLTP